MIMRRNAALLSSVFLAATPPAQAQDLPCSPVSTATLSMANLIVTGSKWQEPDKGLPRHCLLTGKMNERTSSDGKVYAITFEMRLPAEWNGRFLHQVNGGNDGVVVAALGDRPEGPASGGRVPLARGFAVLSSDSGHNGSDPVQAAAGLARGAAFGLDAQARRDYGYAANMTLAPMAKAILAAHYGKRPDFSYMAGCSNGGRHAMVAASRMPEQYDGFLVGNPGFNLPRAAIQHAWDIQNFLKADGDVRKSLTREDGAVLSQRIIQACDELDGVRDGIVSNTAACQKAFDIKSVQCSAGGSNVCLAPEKVAALAAVFAGPKNSRGEALYATWPVDGGVGLGNWRTWKVESAVPPWNNYPIIATMGAASLRYIFTTPPTPVAGTTDGLLDSLKAFNFDTDAPKIFSKDAGYPESAMDFMTPLDVDDPKLAAFMDGKRRMLIYHGVSDPVFSFDDLTGWHDKLTRNIGASTSDHVRLFALPGVTHCGGGPGLDQFDALTALQDWVEKGLAPARLIATANPANRDVPAEWSKGRTRPLCPWPSYARYRSGDIEKAESFTCAAP